MEEYIEESLFSISNANSMSQFQFIYKILTFYFEHLLRNLYKKNTVLDA